MGKSWVLVGDIMGILILGYNHDQNNLINILAKYHNDIYIYNDILYI